MTNTHMFMSVDTVHVIILVDIALKNYLIITKFCRIGSLLIAIVASVTLRHMISKISWNSQHN